MTYKIQKNMPIPKRSRTRQAKYPFSDIKDVGDGFVVPAAEAPAIDTLRTRAWKVGKRRGIKLRVDKLENGNLQVVRIK